MAFFAIIFGLFLEGASFGPMIIVLLALLIVPVIGLAMLCAAIWPPDMHS